jgi:peptide/nickel transport system permease protein
MRRFIFRRLIQALLLILIVSFISFGLSRIASAGPEAEVANNPLVRPETLQRIRESYGLNDPIPLQYIRWLWNALQGDFGRSYKNELPVIAEIGRVLPNTLMLLGFGVLLGLTGIPAGIYLAFHKEGFWDKLFWLVAALAMSLPSWWLALILLISFNQTFTHSFGIRLLPLPGYLPTNADNLFYNLWQLLLPTLLVGLNVAIYYCRLTRTQVLEVLNQNYVRAAVARGLTPPTVNYFYILRNALLPIVTALGNTFPNLIAGAVIFENVFAIAGMGRLTVSALQASDYPVLSGCLFLTSSLLILSNLLTDILYPVLNPVITYD